MPYLRNFLDEDALQSRIDCISVISYIAQTNLDDDELEMSTTLLFRAIINAYKQEFGNAYRRIFNELTHKKFFTLHDGEDKYYIYVTDKLGFKLLLISSLRFHQAYSADELINPCFEHMVRHIIDDRYLTIPSFIVALRLLENILNKRADLLTVELCQQLMQFLNAVAASPLIGFRQRAQSISRIVLRNMSKVQKNVICDIDNFPFRGCDLNDILQSIPDCKVRDLRPVLISRILDCFSNNSYSREGGCYYERVLSVWDFGDFVKLVFPYFLKYLQQIEDEKELYQSISKYWIPISVKHYKCNLFDFIKQHKVSLSIKAQILQEIKKTNFYNKLNHDCYAIKLLNYKKTYKLGLQIFCIYLKKNIHPDLFELNAIKLFIECYNHNDFSTDIIKSIKLLFSQIFIVGHLVIKKNDNEECLNLYQTFLSETARLCWEKLFVQKNEFPVQILTIIWTTASCKSSNLHTLYKLDREINYEKNGNLFYEKLCKTGFWNANFNNIGICKQIELILTKKQLCTSLIDLSATYYVNNLNLSSIGTLTELLSNTNGICVQNSELVRSYAQLIILNKEQNDFHGSLSNLEELFYQKIKSFRTEDLHFSVLVLDVLSVYKSKVPDYNLVPIIQNSLDFLDHVFRSNLHVDLDVKKTKVLESFINNIIDCLALSRSSWKANEFQKETILQQLFNIIQKSNMKRPVCLAVGLVQDFGAIMEENETDRELKIRLLDKTLNCLLNPPEKLNLKLRRNIEVRLVIQALVNSIDAPKSHSKKFYLDWVLHTMQDILKHPNSTDSSLSTTLHSLEVLISDKSLHQMTLKFIPEIIKHCICLFNNTSWIVRNADLQLLKALIERILGVSLNDACGLRPKSVEELFLLFPTVVFNFHQNLSTAKLNDSAIIVMLFFTESQIKTNVLTSQNLAKVLNCFRFLFIDLLGKYSYDFGALAVKSFSSLALDYQIPNTIQELCDHICLNYDSIRKNMFVNLLLLLRQLLIKYIYLSHNRSNKQVSESISRLVHFLRLDHNYFYLNLLSIKIESTEVSMNRALSFLRCKNICYKKRIWLNNNLYFLINTISTAKLNTLLTDIFVCKPPDFLQMAILNALVERFRSPAQIPANTLKILILNYTNISDFCDLLIVSYSKTIQLFIDTCFEMDDELTEAVRADYSTQNIYKLFVYVTLQSKIKIKVDSDVLFSESCLKNYKLAISSQNDELLSDLSVTISALFSVSSLSAKFDIIKIVLFLLLHNNTADEMCRFVSNVVNTSITSVVFAFKILLHEKFLTNCIFYDCKISFKLLLDFFDYINQLADNFIESDTYYLIKTDFSVPLQTVKLIIQKAINCSK